MWTDYIYFMDKKKDIGVVIFYVCLFLILPTATVYTGDFIALNCI